MGAKFDDLRSMNDLTSNSVEHSCRIEFTISADFEGPITQDALLASIRSSLKLGIRQSLQQMAGQLNLSSTSVTVTPIIIECSSLDETDEADEFEVHDFDARTPEVEPVVHEEEADEESEEEDDEFSSRLSEESEIPDYDDEESHEAFEKAYSEVDHEEEEDEDDEDDEEGEDEEDEGDDDIRSAEDDEEDEEVDDYES